ncbi:MAG: PulJ/GspJ family protein [Opitutales bacterium]
MTPIPRRCKPRYSAPDARSGFSLIEVLVVLTVGAIIITGMVTAYMQISRGTLSLAYYAEMKNLADRAVIYLENDVEGASGIAFPTPREDEVAAFSLLIPGEPSVTYAYKVDPDPPKGIDDAYALYRDGNWLAGGLVYPTGETRFFTFFGPSGTTYEPFSNSLDQRRAIRNTTRIGFHGRLLRGTDAENRASHEISVIYQLKES